MYAPSAGERLGLQPGHVLKNLRVHQRLVRRLVDLKHLLVPCGGLGIRLVSLGNTYHRPRTFLGVLEQPDSYSGADRGADYPGGHYVKPCIAAAKNEFRIVQEETFAPILYIINYGAKAAAADDILQAVALHNAVPQGLSSAVFTNHLLEAEIFLSHMGSDCGIANVNIGTSGAEIGGAFGGEKETGGGRESGSDAWKAYMRRQTNTLNWGTELPLAQGIKFGD